MSALERFLDNPNIIKIKDISSKLVNYIDPVKNEYYDVQDCVLNEFIRAWHESKTKLFEVPNYNASLFGWKVPIDCINYNEDFIEQLTSVIVRCLNLDRDNTELIFSISDTEIDREGRKHKYIICPSLIGGVPLQSWVSAQFAQPGIKPIKKILLGLMPRNIYSIKTDRCRAYAEDITKYSWIDLVLNYIYDTDKYDRYKPEPANGFEMAFSEYKPEQDTDYVLDEQIEAIRHIPVINFFYTILGFMQVDTMFIIKCLMSPKDKVFDREDNYIHFEVLAKYYALRVRKEPWSEEEFAQKRAKARDEVMWESKVHILMYAKQESEERFNNAVEKLCVEEIKRDALKENKLKSGSVARLLYYKFGYKYLVNQGTKVEGSRKITGGDWFIFNEKFDKYSKGKVYKWQALVDLTALTVKISHFRDYVDRARKEIVAMSKMSKTIERNLGSLNDSLDSVGFLTEVMKHMELYCSETNYLMLLNRVPGVIGVGNGVLDLRGEEAILIRNVHILPVSNSTFVDYVIYDPNEYNIRKVFDIMSGIIPERDALDFILSDASLALRNAPSNPQMISLNGTGRNGKTTIVMMIANALGEFYMVPEYTYAAPINLLTTNPGNATGADSSVMPFERSIFVYAEESARGAKLSAQRLKQIFGRISARELHSRQSNFTPRARVLTATNYDFIIEDLDQGTWRRFKRYVCSRTFTENPTSQNEAKVNNDIYDVYVKSPECHQAVLSILVHYHMKMKNEYAYDMNKVISPTIERYTLEYRNTQDRINLFITRNILTAIDPSTVLYRVLLAQIVDEYISWHSRNYGIISKTTELMSDFGMCAFKNHIEIDKVTGEVYVNNCRSITQTIGNYLSGQILDVERKLITSA